MSENIRDRSQEIILPKPEEIKPIEEPEKPFSIEEIYDNITAHTPKIKLVSNLGEEKISTLFHLSALTRKKKYGTKESIKLTESGEECINASLSITDNVIFYPRIEFKGNGKITKAEEKQGIKEKKIVKSTPTGIKRSVSVDENGDYVKRKEIEYYDEEGNPLEVYESNLYSNRNPREVEITEITDIETVLDTNILSRYILFPMEGENDEQFKTLIKNMESMSPPRFLTFKFNYRRGTNRKDVYLLLIEENGKEYILMCVGLKMDIKWVSLEEIPEEDFFEGLDLEL